MVVNFSSVTNFLVHIQPHTLVIIKLNSKIMDFLHFIEKSPADSYNDVRNFHENLKINDFVSRFAFNLHMHSFSHNALIYC